MSLTDKQSKDDFLPTSAQAIAPYLIFAFAVFAAYSNIYDNAFLYDDNSLIQLNEYLRDWKHISDILTSSTASGAHFAGGFYRPVQMLLYLLAFHLGDGSPFWFHLLNLSLHIANTCFVYRLGTKLGFKPWAVFLATLLWGLHPMHTEAVTYISGASDLLFVFFCLLSLVNLAPDFSFNKIFKIIPLFLLGLLSKETAAVFPLLVVACLFLTSPQRLNIRTYFRTWPLWIITLIYSLGRLHADGLYGPQNFAQSLALPEFVVTKMYVDHPIYRIYTFLATLPAYLALLIWPNNLHMERGFPLYENAWSEPVIMGFGIALLAAAQILRSAKRPNRGIEMSWGLLWFAAGHVPDSGILIPMNSLFFEHWMYLPSAGLFLGIAETLAKTLQGRSRSALTCSAVVLAIAGLLSHKTYDQNKIWHDPVSFYGNIIHYNDRSEAAYGNLGIYYSSRGDYAEAIDQFKKAIEISDIQSSVRHNLAVTYLHMPDGRAHIPDAIANLQRALELDPNDYYSIVKLGDLYNFLGDKDKEKYYRDRAAALLSRRE